MRFFQRFYLLFLLLFLITVSFAVAEQSMHTHGSYPAFSQIGSDLSDGAGSHTYSGELPTLGTYPTTTLVIGRNSTVIPSTVPTDTTSITVSTHTSFRGRLTADPATGVVRVTNAYPANIPQETYPVTVKAFGPGGVAIQTFTLTVISGSPCQDATGFISVPEIPVERPIGMAIGDFNNDGIQDFASSTTETSNTVRIRLGNGDGSFTSEPDLPMPTNSSPSLIGIGDFNGDGNQDLAVPLRTGGAVSIELGNGSGGFTHFINIATSNASSSSIAIGDFNGDRIQDFATNNLTFTNVNIRLGIGNGGFTAAPNVATGFFPSSIALGDFNGDGLQDIVAATTFHSVGILLGNGSGGFTALPSVAVSNAPNTVKVGDFNNDGKQDLAASIPNSNTVAIRLGDGSGGFISPAVPEVMARNVPQGLEIGDFNRDGKQDFAAANSNVTSGVNSFSIRYGDGNGGFTLPDRPEVPLGGSSYGSTAIADFNGDGIQDLAATDTNSSRVSIRLGSCSPFSVNGTVRYGTATGFPNPRLVSNVTISGAGSINVSTTTIGGTYSLSGFGTGSYILTPSKTGGVNGISSFDAAIIAQYVSGITVLTNNQMIAADVSGNGTVSSFDAAQVARYTASIPGSGLTGTWKFVPVNRSYVTIDNYFDDQDFIALLMGEVSGNWFNSGARPVSRNDGR